MSFTITCNNCGNKIEVSDDKEDENNIKIHMLGCNNVFFDSIAIECKCENYIEIKHSL